MMKKKTIFNASFFNGASSIVDLLGTNSGYRYNPNGYEKDTKALGSDWEKVGNTIRKSIFSGSETSLSENQRNTSGRKY